MKKYLSYILLVSLAYLLYVNEDSKYIVAGVAVFIIGMQFMEDGFKFFSGGILEKLIANSTNTNSKAIFLGITATAILQSSSLIAIIVISFFMSFFTLQCSDTKIMTINGNDFVFGQEMKMQDPMSGKVNTQKIPQSIRAIIPFAL